MKLRVADPARIEKLLTVVRATRPLPDADGRLYYASNVGGHAQVYRQAAPGDRRELVYETEDRVVPHAHTPHGLLVRADSGGNEIWQLGLVTEAGYRPLTTDAKAIHLTPVLHPDHDRAGLGWNPDGQADMVLGELDLRSGELVPWATPGGFWSWSAWSPDGVRGIVTKSLGTPTEASVIDRGGALTRLLPEALRVVPVEWLTEGILVMTDLGRDFLGLALVDPAHPDAIAARLFDENHDLEGVVLYEARSKAALVVNEGVFDAIRVIELPSGRVVEKVALSRGVVVADHSGDAGYHATWAPDGSRLFVSWERATHPGEIYAWPGGTRWTFTSDPPSDLVEPVETSYVSFDGLTIPALFFRIDETPRPAVLLFHGGPEGQSRGGYLPLAQLLTSAGFNLYLPNVRGSTGYGLRYQSLDDKTLRWNGVVDGCEAARHLKKTGLATRTAAYGGSYGGFMTLAVLVEDPELWDAGVDIVGIADWHTFFKNMPPWRGVLRKNEYGDPDGAEADFLRRISPIHRASSIKAPLLVIHGRNDPRVPLEESQQIAHAVPGAEIMVFDDEGHGIAKVANQVKSNGRILEFLVSHLSD